MPLDHHQLSNHTNTITQAPPELPAALTRRFEVRLLPPTNTKAGSLREVI